MKVSYKMAALAALMCLFAVSMRPAAGQGADCASLTNTTCAIEDTDTGCCFDLAEGVCKESSEELATSLDFDGQCRTRAVIDTDAMSMTEQCVNSNATMCNPGSETEPAGCTVTRCFVSIPPLTETGESNWTAAANADGGMAACYEGLNYMLEGGGEFKEGDVALSLPGGASVTIDAPNSGEGPRPGFRVSRFNATMEGNATVGYTATLLDGTTEEGDLEFESDGDFMIPDGYPRGLLYSIKLTNKSEAPEDVLDLVRITYNIC